ncbi:hypothetical protein MKX08_002386 [Trichoderma sp. CBMAI-0020]|nr:hypothetical protein MKX08_002386 [Trichoderma sp. CBMAI-0020]
MMADKPSKPTSRDEFEIAVVCTRALEYDALCLLFDNFWDTDGDSFGRVKGDLNTYTTGCMGNFNVVVVLLCSSGKASAASATANLRSSYRRIKLLLLSGICEGVPDANGQELLLGDVVISEIVIEYDLRTQSAVAYREKNTLEELHWRANKAIRNFTANIKTGRGYELIEDEVALFLRRIQNRVSERKYRWRRKIATYVYPGSTNDILFESTHRHKHYTSSQCICADYNPDEDFNAACGQSKDLDCEQTGCKLNSVKTRTRLHLKNMLESDEDSMSAQVPQIFLGRFGSGDTAFSSGIHRDSLAQKHNIIAFEMESAGVEGELPCIIVKGVSSYGDGHKPRKWAEWQYFAAATAASVTRALIERYPQTDRSPAAELKLQENKACLGALFITNPEDDKERIEETKGGLLLDAYIWIIQNKEFIEWLQDPMAQLLWIKGDPGKGKTMLLCGIIDQLEKESGRHVYYFLCQATDIRHNNSSAVLRGLLYMIIVRQPSLISHVRDEYDKAGRSAFEGANSWVVLSRIFRQMLRDDSLEEPIFIVDAVDECVIGSAQLLQLIRRSSSSSSRVKWLVSSRNQADIHEALAAAETKSTISLELNAASVSDAITQYIRYKVQILSYKRGYKRSIRHGIEKYLSENANGTFLWVALVCALLEKKPRSDPLPESADFPPGLDELYKRMMDGVCASRTSGLGRRVLAIAIVAQRPLTIQELATLIKNNDGDEGQGGEESHRLQYDWEDILEHCSSFLTMRNGIIYFIHHSAKDFLVKKVNEQLFPNGPESTHMEILVASLSAMRNTLRKDIYGLGDPAFSIDNLPHRALSDDPLGSIRYSCVYWIDHFRQATLKGKTNAHESHELIYTFLREKYVYWLEALSLLRSIFDMISGVQKLEQLVADTEISGLRKLTWDARRFIQEFGTVIADFPLQVYLSAMIFSPAQSITRRLFGKEAHEWVQTLPVDEVEWDSPSRTYESNEPSNIARLSVSCCGTWVAAIRSNATIPIWQTRSGKTIRVLDACLLMERENYYEEGKNLPEVCFSPWSSKELSSSVPKDPGVIIWDVTTGKVVRQLSIRKSIGKIHLSYLTSARDQLGCLCRDSRGNRMVSIWNTKTGQLLKSTLLPEGSGLYILSPTNGFEFSWAGEDLVKYVEPFNMDTNSAIHILGGTVGNWKFSPDGLLLVISTENRKVTILPDTTSTKIQQTFEVATDIEDFAISPDGKLLAIATLGGIEVFSLASGKCLRKIMTKMIYVAEIARETLLSLGWTDLSRDHSILIYGQVSISPNGKLIASVSKDPRLKLRVMDIKSRKIRHVLENSHLDEARNPRILFSPDSKKLALVSEAVVMLWNISSWLNKATIVQKKSSWLGYEDMEEDFAFSSDSTRFATTLHEANLFSTYDFTIKSPTFRMPTYVITASKNALPPEAKQALARVITATHCKDFNLAFYLCQVVFQDVEPSNQFLNAEPVTVDQIRVRGDVRTGRSEEQKARIIELINGEYGRILPRSGQEAEFIAKLPVNIEASARNIGHIFVHGEHSTVLHADCHLDIALPCNFPFNSPGATKYLSLDKVYSLIRSHGEDCKSFVDGYLALYQPVHPIIDPALFTDEINCFWEDPTQVDVSWLSTFLMVLALGSFTVTRDVRLIVEFCLAAEACLAKTAFLVRPSMSVMRTLCLIVVVKQLANGTCWSYDASWSLLGMIVRLAVCIGLHKPPTSTAAETNAVTYSEWQSGRILWITIVYLCIQTAAVTGMPTLLSSDDILEGTDVQDASLPHVEGVGPWISVSDAFPTICKIIARVNSGTKVPYEEILGYNTTVRRLMAAAMDHPECNDSLRAILDIFFRRVLMVLHRCHALLPNAPVLYPICYWASLECSLAILVHHRDFCEHRGVSVHKDVLGRLYKLDYFAAALTASLYLLQRDAPLANGFAIPPRQTIRETLETCTEIWGRDKDRSICLRSGYRTLTHVLAMLSEMDGMADHELAHLSVACI